MLFNLPLKQTRQVEFNKAIEQSILTSYGEPTLYTEVLYIF
jgi:hypothetical protein